MKKIKEEFLGMLSGTLCANLLGNLLTGKKVEQRVKKGTVRAAQDF